MNNEKTDGDNGSIDMKVLTEPAKTSKVSFAKCPFCSAPAPVHENADAPKEQGINFAEMGERAIKSYQPLQALSGHGY